MNTGEEPLRHLPAVQRLVQQALEEDLGAGDVTTNALIPPSLQGEGSLVAKGEGVLAGIEVAALVFHQGDPSLKFRTLLADGLTVQPRRVLAVVEGSVASMLRAERTALNFLQRMSGIATETARYVQAVAGLPVRILDTRKTAPGLRLLDKYAVRWGGGANHRFNLNDGVLIKDNHIAALKSQGGTLRDIVRKAKSAIPHTLKVEIEVSSLASVQEAVEAGADAILLDNMTLEEMRGGVKAAKGKVVLEASGGINLATVRQVAETGVDLISIGALTHSAKALDMSLQLEAR